jgi:hypothetical protein
MAGFVVPLKPKVPQGRQKTLSAMPLEQSRQNHSVHPVKISVSQCPCGEKPRNCETNPIFNVSYCQSKRNEGKYFMISRTHKPVRSARSSLQGFPSPFKAIQGHSNLFKGFWKKKIVYFSTHPAPKNFREFNLRPIPVPFPPTPPGTQWFPTQPANQPKSTLLGQKQSETKPNQTKIFQPLGRSPPKEGVEYPAHSIAITVRFCCNDPTLFQ